MPMILPRRGIIGPPRGPFAFPGTKAGFDPSHPASLGTRISAVVRGGGVLNVLNGKVGTKTGTPVSVIDPSLGEALDCELSDDGATFSGQSTTLDASFTMAGIFRIPTASGFSTNTLICLSADAAFTTGALLGLNASGNPNLQIPGGTGVASTLALSLAVPYFMACSNRSGSTLFVARRLDNGQVLTDSKGGTVMANAPNGTVGVFCDPVTGVHSRLHGYGKAVMWNNQFMSLPALMAWSADPWSYWYPR